MKNEKAEKKVGELKIIATIMIVGTLFAFGIKASVIKSFASYSDSWTIDSQSDWSAGIVKTHVDTTTVPGSLRKNIAYNDLTYFSHTYDTNFDTPYWGVFESDYSQVQTLNFYMRAKKGFIPQIGCLKAYWKHEDPQGNVLGDYTDNNHSGAATNITFQEIGMVDKCAKFNGYSSYVTISNHNDFVWSAGTPVSINCWVKISSGSWGSFIMKRTVDDAVNKRCWDLVYSAGKVSFYIHGRQLSEAYTYLGKVTTNGISGNVWHMITATWDGQLSFSGIKIYVDGVEVSTQEYGGNMAAVTDTNVNVLMGRYLEPSYALNGWIDEMMYWKGAALSSQEIFKLYANGSPDSETYSVGTKDGDWREIIPGQIITSVPFKRDIQFKIYMWTVPPDYTSQVNSIKINWFVDSAPFLVWTKESNYENDGLHPEGGNSLFASFMYRMKYIDSDNDPPASGYPKVHILKNGAEITNSPFTMSEVDPFDSAYTDGKLYYYSIALNQVGNDYTYYFSAYDTWTYAGTVYNLKASGTPTSEINAPDVANDLPTLTWAGESNYRDKGLYPPASSTSEAFNYRVKYTDQNNIAPAWVKVHILKSGSELSGSPFSMAKVDAGDNTDTDGVLYSYSTTLSSGNDHTYYFESQNINSWHAMGQATSTKDGPDVAATLPELTWVGTGEFFDKGVSPISGDPSTAFVYKINYTDVGNNAPQSEYPKVHIFRNGIEVSNSPFTMLQENPSDNVYSDGKIYQHTTSLGGGYYSYYFESFNNQNWAAKGVGTGEKDGPTVSTPPVLSWTGGSGYTTDGVSPDIGDTATKFVYRIVYTDADNDSPASGYPRIRILKSGSEIINSPFVMSEDNVSDTNFIDGKIYACTCTLSESGTYQYMFEAKDIYNFTATGAPGTTKDGPIVSGREPFLFWAGDSGYETDAVSPNRGDTSTVFVFKIKYQDIDNDAPADSSPLIRLFKNGTEFDSAIMQPTDAGDLNCADGKLYQHSRTMPQNNAKYSYYIEAKDQFNWGAIGQGTSPCSGPIVSQKPTIPQDITVYPGPVVGDEITLKWASTDLDGDTITYELNVGSKSAKGQSINSINIASIKASADTISFNPLYRGPNTSYTMHRLMTSTVYLWYVKAEDSNGQTSISDVFVFVATDESLRLLNYPNPFNPQKESTSIVFFTTESGQAEITVWSEFGEKMFGTTMTVSPGANTYIYNGRDSWGNILENGSYIVTIKTSSKIDKHVILVLKR